MKENTFGWSFQIVYNPGKEHTQGSWCLSQHQSSDLGGSVNTDKEYLLNTIWEAITPCDEYINEQQKKYTEMISTNTLNELGNTITLAGFPLMFLIKNWGDLRTFE